MPFTPPTVAELLARNAEESKTWEPKPFLSEAAGLGLAAPSVIVITCCDVRCQPFEFLRATPADILNLRNVGGHVAPLLTAIAGLDGFIGMKEVMVIHHTDCGTTHYTDAGIREGINQRAPGTVDEKTSFGAMTDLEGSVRENLKVLRESPIIRPGLAEQARGFVFDVKTGALTPVE